MVELMNTHLGIFSIDVSGDHNIYFLKDNHKSMEKSVLDKLLIRF